MRSQRNAADATVARLEVHAGSADPIVARLRIEAMLGALELRPHALSPSAILCVREMRDPLPGRLSLASRQLRPPPAWEEAMRREVDRFAAAASWPARAAVPPTAEAIAFADEAELLACLGSDLIAGGVPGRWWWRLLVPGTEEPRRAVGAAFRRDVEHAPAAFERLAGRSEAAAFVRALDDADVRALAAEIAVRFALPVLARIATIADVPQSLQTGALSGRAAKAQEALAPPWRALALEAEEAALPPQRRALLGIVLTLARAPAVARSAVFAAQVVAWRDAVEPPPVAAAPPTAAALPAISPPSADATRPLRPTAVAPSSQHGTDPSEKVAIASAVHVVAHDSQAAPAAATTETLRSVAAPSAETPADASSPFSLAETAPPVPVELATAPIETRAADHPRWSPPAPPRLLSLRPRRALGPATDTGLGGLFYLLNLALYLRLYGDDENLALSPWDFVELVGRRLLDTSADQDPVWPLLAALSGRDEGEPPGQNFAPPLDWRMPAQWLQPFGPSAAGWSIEAGRLLVTHTGGFVLLDLPANASLADELLRYGELTPIPSSPPSLPDALLERWLLRLIPYLRARLGLALSLDAEEDLSTLLFRHGARVHLSEAHLDIVLSLEQLPVAIRLAGLDRDPGWVAAAGRFIAFHFE